MAAKMGEMGLDEILYLMREAPHLVRDVRRAATSTGKFFQRTFRKRKSPASPSIPRKRKTKTIRTKFVKARRPPKRTNFSRRRPTGAFRVASFSKPFAKGRAPSLSTKYAKRHYDDYGAISRNHSLWAGFQTHGCRERLMQMASEAMLRALLSRVDSFPTAFDQVFENGGPVQAIKINWKWTNMRTGDDVNIEKEYVVGGRSFETIATDIANDWKAQDEEVYQGVPSSATIFRNDYTSASANVYRAVRHVEDLNRMKLMLYAKQVVRVQNLTPNNAGTDVLDTVGTNPVQGKIYEFTTPPRVREQVVETHTDTRGLQQHDDTTTGVYQLPNSAITGVDGIIGHPPPAGGLFTNCRKSAVVSIKAGGQKFKTTMFKFEGTLLEFAQKFRLRNAAYAQGQEYKAFGGGIFWLGLENKFRQGQDTVKIGFNRELTMMGRAEFARHRPMLRHYEQTDLGDTM